MSAPFDALGGSRRSSLVSGTQSLRRDYEPHRVSSGRSSMTSCIQDSRLPGTSYHELRTEEHIAMELLEREHQLAQLEEHLRQAAAGYGRLVLVGGEAGVG